MVYDNQGRLLRWSYKEPIEFTNVTTRCCQSDSNYKEVEHKQNKQFLNNLEKFQSQFYDNLEVSKRAIANWKKLRVLLILLKIFNGSPSLSLYSNEDSLKKEK